MRVVTGAVFDVAVDLRRSSKTFGRWVGYELSAENKRQAWIPPGFAHGFLSLQDGTELLYKCTDFYSAEAERSLIWNDPDIAIAWPFERHCRKRPGVVRHKACSRENLDRSRGLRVRCLVIGAGGQLGRALLATSPAEIDLIAPARSECDLTNEGQIEHWLNELRPNVVFNAAAYTAVDAAESDEASMPDLINATSVARLAEAVRRHGARLVHVSTDFVFDGETSRPYAPDDKPNPLNAYGRTKRDGEVAILRSGADALIVRTAWVYFERGRNFVHTMLRLMRERDEVKVVSDQIGTPTYARNLARALWTLAREARVRPLSCHG